MPIEIIIAILGSGVLSTFISGIFSIVNTRKHRNTHVEEGLLVLLYKEIKDRGVHSIREGQISYDEYEDLNRMYTIYKAFPESDGLLDNIKKDLDRLKKV